MTVIDALVKVYANPYRVGIRRPSSDFVLVYNLLFDKAGIVIFWRKSFCDDLPPLDRERLIAGVGRGALLFSIDDVLADDWETVDAGSAEAALYDGRGSDFNKGFP